MSEQLSAALGQGKITKSQYDTYVLFHLNALGHEYLKNTLMSIVLDVVPFDSRDSLYIRKEGERDAWVRIRRSITEVNTILESMNNDRTAISYDRDEDRDATERKLNAGTINGN